MSATAFSLRFHMADRNSKITVENKALGEGSHEKIIQPEKVFAYLSVSYVYSLFVYIHSHYSLILLSLIDVDPVF